MGIPLFTSPISHLKFAHERCVTSSSWSTRGNSRLHKSQTFIKWAIPLNDIPTCSNMDTYYMCRTCHFRWKGQWTKEIQLLNTQHDRWCCHGVKRWRCSGAVRLTRSASRKKTGAWTFATGGEGDSDTCHQDHQLRGNMATPTAIALDSSFNLLLICRILVDTNRNGQHHVIIGFNHG